MSRHSEAKLTRTGVITIVALALALTAAFNLRKLPWLAGTTYQAEFSDASGLHVGSRVEVAGIRVGRVSDIEIEEALVVVSFSVDGTELGHRSEASVGVLNLLGEKYLDITPQGGRNLDAGSTIPLARTSAGSDIVGTFGDLAETTEAIDTQQLAKALTTMSGTLEQAGPEVQGAFQGIAALSQTIAARGDELEALLQDAEKVVQLVNERKQDIVGVMKNGDQVFAELISRRQAIHQLLVNATALAEQLKALVKENEKQIGPALDALDQALKFLNARDEDLTKTIQNYGPYASILINIIGTGPWFDAYLANLTGIVSGEFVPGRRPGIVE
ncbi:MCE family protein [Nocardioides sp. NPDC006273]|uniref:MCE family protein n=1 Tax=Nocardioides sp. NPDC006273 TaxID=3155598 RepID=UPI0033A83D06